MDPAAYQSAGVKLFGGLFCTMAGVRECRRRYPRERLVVLWLGSSVGNFSDAQAVQFFKDVLAAGGHNLQVLLQTRIPTRTPH